MKRIVGLAALVVALTACGSSGPPEKEDLIEACRDARIGAMDADADPENLGADWPADFEYTELKNGTYSARWNEASTLYYTCVVAWEEGKAVDVQLDYTTP